MLPEMIEALGADARRNLARNLFKGFWERGLSANKALDELRASGLGYRRTEFLTDYRQDKTGYDLASSIRYVNVDKVPSESKLEGLYHGVPDKYSFVFKASGVDATTGEDREQYFFYHRDTIDTRGNMEQEASDWFDEQSDRYGFEVEDIRIVEGYINPVWK